MIQRKQTLYLLCSGLLMLAAVWLPLAKLISSEALTLSASGFEDMLIDPTYYLIAHGGPGALNSSKVLTLSASGFEDMQGNLIVPTYHLLALGGLGALSSIIAIFLYQRRGLQMRVTIFGLLLKVGFYLLTGLHIYLATRQSDTQFDTVTPWLAAPAVAIILDYLAHRSIAVDDRLIKSIDRLR